MLQNAIRLRKSAPGPPNSSDEHVSCTAPATENASLQILFERPTPAIVFGNATKSSRFSLVVFFNMLTSKCASRHNSDHFFDVAASKSGPNMVCFVHFHLEMCFAPQRRTLFDITTSKRCPNMWYF